MSKKILLEKLIKSGRGVSVVIATLLMVTVILAASFVVYVAMMGQIPVWQQTARPPSAASPLLIDQIGWYDKNNNKRLDGGDVLGLVVINNGANVLTIDRVYIADISATLIGGIYMISSGGKITVWTNVSPPASFSLGKPVKIAVATTRGEIGITFFPPSVPSLQSSLDHDYLYMHGNVMTGMKKGPAFFMDNSQPNTQNSPTTLEVSSSGIYFYTNPLGESFLKGTPHKFEIHLWLQGSGTVLVKMLDCDQYGVMTDVTGVASETFDTGKNYKEFTFGLTNPAYVLQDGHRLVLWVGSSSGTFTLNLDGGNYHSRILVSV